MTASEVAKHLLDSCESLGEFESFMFGSSIFGVGNDFDILIVGPSGDSLSRLKAELKIAGSELSLDILCMLHEEVMETEFVTAAGCMTLTELAESGGTDKLNYRLEHSLQCSCDTPIMTCKYAKTQKSRRNIFEDNKV